VEPVTRHLTSSDGTRIAYRRYGEGSPVIIIGGAQHDGTTVAGVAAALSDDVAAVTYDRRARGSSTNEDREFQSERELEDLAAVIEAVSPTAGVFGHSSGAVLSLEAAMSGLPIPRLAVYEPPYIVEGTRPLPPEDIYERIRGLAQAGRREETVVAFFREAVGLPGPVVDGLRAGPAWGHLMGFADALPYDVAVHRDFRVPVDRLARLDLPVLVVDGSASFPWIRETAGVVADAIPGAGRLTLEGVDHSVFQRPDAIRQPLIDFFG
jgi:hypothetical protein